VFIGYRGYRIGFIGIRVRYIGGVRGYRGYRGKISLRYDKRSVEH